MSRDQTQVFATGEGDAWFARNQNHLEAYDPERDPVARAIHAAGIAPKRILDLGCSSGTRLSALCHRYAAQGTGIEPSVSAVALAQARDPRLTWHVGTLDAHPTLPERFDVVIVSFVLHWVDRRRLLASLAAIDATVADGGCVVIHDFLPDHPLRREYHHLAGAGVFTYKNDYAAMLLATGLYRPLLQQTLGYPDFTQATPATVDRASLSVLARIPVELIPLG